MVRILIALRRTVLRNQLARTNPAMLLIGAGLVLLSALGTIWLGLVAYPNHAAATDVLALVFLLWVGGRVAQSALAGDAVLRPELFSLLPLDRRRLARSLLIVFCRWRWPACSPRSRGRRSGLARAAGTTSARS